MSAANLTAALLELEPTPPDEVKPRAVPYERLDVSVMRPPGCRTWRVSVLVHVEAGPPHAFQSSAGSMIEGWNQALQFVERATGVVR